MPAWNAIYMKMPPFLVSLPLDGGGKGRGDFHPSLCPCPRMEVIPNMKIELANCTISC